MRYQRLAITISPLILLAMTGCGASTASSETAEGPVDGRETLVVGTAPTLRPLEYVDENDETTGLIIDLIKAVGEELELNVTFERMSFDGLIPALQSERIDMITSMGVLPERRETVTFINYLESGAALMVPDGNPESVSGPEDLCGLEVAFAKGSAQQAVTQEASEECVAAGEEEVKLAVYESGSEAVLALRSGQADASWTDVVNASFVMDQTPDTFEVAYTNPGFGYGIGFPKENVELREDFMAALQTLRENGTYDELAEEYGLADATIDEFLVNRGEGLDVPTETPAAP